MPPPAAGEVQVRHTAIALNFSDVNVRRGGFYFAWPLQFPVILGNEGAGIVERVGPAVTEVQPGDRVAYVGSGGVLRTDRRLCGGTQRSGRAPNWLPDGVTDRQAAGMMVKGFTASLIINHVYRPKPGDTILIHAAASGVGLILTQWSKHLGATVIGTVGSSDKARVAQAHGCDHTILYRDTDFTEAVKEIIPQGVSAVFDGVGKDTFMASLRCVRPFAMLVNYGNASGHPPPLDLLLLAKGGSLSVCRPALSSLTGNVELMRQAAAELFDLVRAVRCTSRSAGPTRCAMPPKPIVTSRSGSPPARWC